MRQAIVPAQVTTVEDRITGSLGLSQLLLLVTPIFTGSFLFFLLPPFGRIVIYKAILTLTLLLTCSLLSIRIKGKIAMFWIVILLRYSLRPRLYVFDKREAIGREEYAETKDVKKEIQVTVKPKRARKPFSMSTAEVIQIESLLKSPTTKLHFENTKRGGLYVHITETE
jgi:hypothetical protein